MKHLFATALVLALGACSFGKFEVQSPHGYEAHIRGKKTVIGGGYDELGRPTFGYSKWEGFVVLQPTLPENDGGPDGNARIACDDGSGRADSLSYFFVDKSGTEVGLEGVGSDAWDGNIYAGGCAAQIAAEKLAEGTPITTPE